MEKYSKLLQIRWSDIDQNRHLRHSVYYDYGAMLRVAFLSEHGLTTEKLEELKTGPILFREEAIYKREVKMEDQITIDVELVTTTPDYSRWSLRHNFTKQDGTIVAILNMDGAWMDIEKRKLTIPNQLIQTIFNDFPKASDFQIKTKTSSEKK